MGILDSIVRVLWGSVGSRSLTLRCRDCDHTFESAVRTLGPITCPKCGEKHVERFEP